MDEFDVFNQPSQEVPSAENTNNQENDLFGSMDATNTLDNDNSFNNMTTPAKDDLFNEEELPTSQPNFTSSFDSYAENSSIPQAIDDTLTNDPNSTSEDTSSYDMFSKPMPATPIASGSIFTTGITSEENLSVLEAFNKRRQQEINEKGEEERQKIEALRQQGKRELDRWYQDRKTFMEQNRRVINNAEDELRTKALEKSDKDNCDWPKVIRFLEFSTGTQLSKAKRDLTRMKTSMLNARNDKVKQKAANGV